QGALQDVVTRHESLRTIFPAGDTPYQKILPAEEAFVVLNQLSVSQAELGEALRQSARYGFDLAKEIPLKAWLFTVKEEAPVLLILLHHIASDGWSYAPFSRDFHKAYAARRQGQVPAYQPLPVQYADYTLWQRAVLGEESDPQSLLSTQARYWEEQLLGLPEQLELPTDRPRPAVASYRGQHVPLRLEPALHQALLKLAQD